MKAEIERSIATERCIASKWRMGCLKFLKLNLPPRDEWGRSDFPLLDDVVSH
jgi:hypothetical protein